MKRFTVIMLFLAVTAVNAAADGGMWMVNLINKSLALKMRDAGMKQGEGLYPAGEGAGYAGGIVSAAIDGSEAAMRLAGEMDG